MSGLLSKKIRLSSFQIIILGFAGVILLGAGLLMLPISSQLRQVTPFSDALFTATSAVCVTGLIVQSTGCCWSAFGQGVILSLIQIGGLGVVTIAVSFSLLSGRRISLMQRSTMQEAIAAPKVGGIVRLTGFILRGTFLVELLGALALMPVFCRDHGVRGVWMAVFHSVSAFCNAGFDLLGTDQAPYASLTAYAADPVVNIVIMLLILIGGIGFLTWEDIVVNKWRIRRYRMQSKVILLMTALLTVIPAVFLSMDLEDLPPGQRILAACFQAVTPRTAGFNTVDLLSLGGTSRAVMVGLMLVGGAPGSTAGGMKLTTLAVLFANAFATFRKREDAQMFGRRIEPGTIRSAATILMLYMTLFLGGAVIISLADGQPLSLCLFETASAVATVGLTLGITPELGLLSRGVLILLMYLGRVGSLTLIYAAVSGKHLSPAKLPQEKIAVG